MTENLNNPSNENPQCCSDDNQHVCWCSKPHWKVFIIAIIAAVVVILINANERGPAIIWQNDYETALQIAKTENKPVLIAFHAPWCGYCEKMKTGAYRDPGVVEFARAVVPLMVESDKDPLVGQFKVKVYPTYVVLKPDGQTAGFFEGFMEPSKFIKKIKALI